MRVTVDPAASKAHVVPICARARPAAAVWTEGRVAAALQLVLGAEEGIDYRAPSFSRQSLAQRVETFAIFSAKLEQPLRLQLRPATLRPRVLLGIGINWRGGVCFIITLAFASCVNSPNF